MQVWNKVGVKSAKMLLQVPFYEYCKPDIFNFFRHLACRSRDRSHAINLQKSAVHKRDIRSLARKSGALLRFLLRKIYCFMRIKKRKKNNS